MPAQLTTRVQVNGYRFLVRRLEHALVRRDVRMLHDPMRSQGRSAVIGWVLAVLMVAGCAIMAFLRPQGSVGDAKIVTGRNSGALYALVDGRLHPVLNLASARLITGSSEEPRSVKDAKLATLPRGPLLGIPGAPAALPGSRGGGAAAWTLCEKVDVAPTGAAVSARGVTSAVLAGEPQSSKDIQPLDDSRALLVSLDERTFLIHDGRRAEVDPDSSAVSRALGIRDVKARPIGLGLLNAAVAAPPIRPPSIPRAGEPSRVAGVKIGAVFTVPGIETHELYVAVAEGVQRISPLTAQIIRNANTVGETGIAAVSPDRLDGVPQVTPLPVTQFPRVAPQIVGADEAPVTCLTWTRDSSDGPARVQMRAGRRLPLDDTATPVRLAGADGAGARLDEVYVAPSSGEFVQVTGIERTSVRRDSLFYIGDNGIRYGIADRETAATLGLGDHPRQAPWAIVGRLPAGPTLRRDAALTAHDSLPQPAP